jgi:hypothetical protein
MDNSAARIHTQLPPDREMLAQFSAAMFKHAGPEGFVSLRSFYEDDSTKPFRVTPTSMKGGLPFLIDAVEDDANRAANDPRKVVFCPPIAIFSNRDRAREKDILAGLALSVECDQHPREARATLEEILGPATLVVRSGGEWTDPETGQIYDKLHLHWRLRSPARGAELVTLKAARDLAARLCGGDPSNKPVCHPIRWPGSWHRKGEPKLCEIETETEHEIDLDTALAALVKASPVQGKADDNAVETGAVTVATDWAELVSGIVTGSNYHGAEVRLASKMITAGMADGAVVNMLRGIFENANVPRDARWHTRYADIPRAVSTAREKYGAAGTPAAVAFTFDPASYAFPDPALIPRREWLYGRHYIRGAVSATIGAPGRLKSTTALTEMIGMTVGRNLMTGEQLPSGPLRAAYLNGEEVQDELDRRVAAICQHFELKPQDCGGRLWVRSTRDKPIRVAIRSPRGDAMVQGDVVTALTDWCDQRQIDVIGIDPLISFHTVRESDNGDMDLVCKEAFGAIAGTRRAVDLVHHPRKLAPGESNATVDDARGASAVLGAVRLARTFNFMTTAEAAQLGIVEDDRRRHVRIENGKSNPGPIGKAHWVKIETENLPNGDEVACSIRWSPPNPFDGVTVGDLRLVQKVVTTGEFRTDSRSPDWLGWWMAENLPRLNVKTRHSDKPRNKAEVIRLSSILKTWKTNNALDTETRLDKTSQKREFFTVGTTIEPPQPARSADDDDDQINL